MKITVVGAGSNTAASLVPMLLEETEAELHLLSSKNIIAENPRVTCSRVDITNRSAMKDLVLQHLPNVIINTAAMTNVDACENEKQKAHELNAGLVEQLIRLARQADAHLIHLSTDYVFEGASGPYAETDVPAPINYYGRTKLAGENALHTSGIDYTIVRTNVLYGPLRKHLDFVQWVIEALDDGREITVVTDQYCNPTYVDDLAEAIINIALNKRTGLYHVAGADYMSRYDIALEIARFLMANTSLIKPITTEELSQQAKRPLKAGLITLKAEAELRMRFRGLRSGLVSIRHDMYSRGR